MDDEGLLAAVESREPGALNELLEKHRGLVRDALNLRMDGALRSRLDASDIVQEASLVVSTRIADFLERRPMPFRLWFRQTALECLLQARRQHMRDRRDVSREITLDDHSAAILAERLAPPSPSQTVRTQERAAIVRRTVEALPEADREILLLRSFEGLTNAEAAIVLALEPDAVSKRFTRALVKLRERLLLEGLTGTEP